MFERLSERIESSVHKLRGRSKISEINIAESLKDIRRALIDADVSYKTAKNFIASVKEKAIGEQVIQSLKPDQLIIKIVRDELAQLMGSETKELDFKGKPNTVLIAGLQGSGKTTFTSKLALFLKTQNHKKVLLAACDVYRPAAIEQLKVMGDKVGVEVYTDMGNDNPIAIAQAAQKKATEEKFDLLIIDTAGRLSVDKEMMDEVKNIHRKTKPNHTLFVVDAMTGQDAILTARTFNDYLDFDGVVLTKMDGDTRGGAALSIRAEVGKPIVFVSNGEKPENLEVFHPNRMADRILGMGDMVSFVERAQQHQNEEEARRINKKIAKNQFDFEDFQNQIGQIKKMGSMKDLMGMIPGMNKMAKGLDIDDQAFKGIEAIIGSMTPYERRNPKVLNMTRKKRIANGSGTKVEEVNQLIKQFNSMKKMMQMVNKGGMKNLGGLFKGMPKF